jgi:hypothetical protein
VARLGGKDFLKFVTDQVASRFAGLLPCCGISPSQRELT